VNDSTGYSPYFLMHGREMLRPEEIYTISSPETEFETEQKWATHACTTLAAAYKHAYENQMEAAQNNMDYRSRFMKEVSFFPGQKVIYWQPTASKSGQLRRAKESEANAAHLVEDSSDTDSTDDQGADDKPDHQDEETEKAHGLAEQAKDSGAVFKLPSKWTYKWTGPHTIVSVVEHAATDGTESPTANVYVVKDAETHKNFKANVNRIAPFYPWSDSKITTSPDVVSHRDYKIDGVIDIGSLAILPLDAVADDGAPVILGKVTGRDEATGHLTMQWLWNYKGSMLAPMHEGWLDKRDNRWMWAKPTKREENHYRPFLTDEDAGVGALLQTDVLMHGFKLDGKGRLPTSVLRALSDNPTVLWTLPAA
jgi:hypothetical protein